MMTTSTKRKALTSAFPAIAAALALSSTSALAQDVQPVPTDPAPTTVAPDPVPVVDSTPAATEAAPTPTVDTQATSIKATVKRTARTAIAKPAPSKVTRSAGTVTHVATTAAIVPALAKAIASATPVTSSKVAPIVDLNSSPATPAPAAAAKPANKDDTLPIAAGGALAFLVLGGAVAATRRRHDEDEEMMEGDEPVEALATPQPAIEREPALVAPHLSAFSWSPPQAVERTTAIQSHESWVERAKRGPTPDNPSLSLRKRLKRAAFFEKREREVAAGSAEPVETDAGLPDGLETAKEREPEFA
jgi:hypothetical protein